ncbi:MAG: ATP-grasp domain-containing protein [Brachybacterium sp.]|nr:ATP-grasp domain-containing protein [Brachybacterium sp.]MDN5686080.1 ATP-grasp domain-containing protein [Brachybacterium sp.]
MTEADPTSSSATYGDAAWSMPTYDDPAYAASLLSLVDELQPLLLVSVNDYELMHLHVHTDLAEQLRARDVLVPGVDRRWQRGSADKLLMMQLLQEIGVQTPMTVTGRDTSGIASMAAQTGELVVKHRFGSGSSGLAVVSASGIDEAIAAAVRSAPRTSRVAVSEDDVIVQPRVRGQEYGVDIVGDLHEPGELSAVLARRKLRMRAGETDKAITAAAEPFRHVAELLARSSRLSGLIDVDMFLDDVGTVSVIDVNPRFGGGYPFVHLAGADVPRDQLASALGLPRENSWLAYREGVTAAKYESVRVTEGVA